MIEEIKDYFRELTGPPGDLLRWYGGLDPEMQRNAMLLLVCGVVGLIGWIMYQAHGDRVVIVLPAMVVRYSLILLVLPMVLLGRVGGAGWSVPEFLRRDWTAEEDPDRPRIQVQKVDPMKLPGGSLSRDRARARNGRTTSERSWI